MTEEHKKIIWNFCSSNDIFFDLRFRKTQWYWKEYYLRCLHCNKKMYFEKFDYCFRKDIFKVCTDCFAQHGKIMYDIYMKVENFLS